MGTARSTCSRAVADMLYISTASIPLLVRAPAPLDEIGRGPGEGFTINLPIVASELPTTDYQLVFVGCRPAGPCASSAPISCSCRQGSTLHERDPLGGMRLTAGGFAAMTMELRRVAEECCEDSDGDG